MCAPGRSAVVVLLVIVWLTPELETKRMKKERASMVEPQEPPPRQEVTAKSKGWKRRAAAKFETTGHHQATAQGAPLPPPADTWRAFVRHSEETARRARRRRKKQKRRQRGSLLPVPTRRGPPGPAGPPGPPGAVVTTDKLVEELRKMIQEAAGEHLAGLLRSANATGSVNGHGAALPSLLQLDQVPLVSRVHSAFHVRLADKVPVPKKTFLELRKYQLPFGSGAFLRGEGLDRETGRFTAPEDGLYQLSAQVFLRHKRGPKGSPPRKRPRPAHAKNRLQQRVLRVLICINSQCRRNLSLQYLSSVESTPRLFTASVHGALELRRGQYVSLHVDNRSRFRLLVLAGSQFSGAMLGQ